MRSLFDTSAHHSIITHNHTTTFTLTMVRNKLKTCLYSTMSRFRLYHHINSILVHGFSKCFYNKKLYIFFPKTKDIIRLPSILMYARSSNNSLQVFGDPSCLLLHHMSNHLQPNNDNYFQGKKRETMNMRYIRF